MSVKRYDLVGDIDGNCNLNEARMESSEDGVYVKHRDYVELEQQLAESHRALRAETTAHENTQMQLEKMAAENAGMKESRQRLAEFIHEELDAGYPLNMNIETPATDAFLAEVRAQESKRVYESILDNPAVTDMESLVDWLEQNANDSVAFAAQLRKGVQS